ncbi:putative zinc-binding metallopeptidase [Flavivirga amylovorans]|uniref:Zinc-binding metallopeptidase n=1 Tax=Flavivirga amylovorans TaxID=870486 RepID=A0ABT8WW14_9FLAO|nr:substrate import-associated zinc metallohydrolase lipoprotein [Flavivirga amylovorans]MDO5985797.1 putative zinc-binding metallopeptidase [Flavivirga amylovorans]
MKHIKKIRLAGFLFVALLLNSCNNSSDTIGESQIDASTPVLSDLDLWLRANFVAPYNIDISYLWGASNTDIARFLYPMQEEGVKRWSETIKKTWIDPYNELGGDDFISKITPRQMVYSGGFNFNPNSPTITLGLAEAGTRITFFNLDFLDYSNVNSIREPLKTLHHEYGHILNQKIPFTDDFGLITPGNYTAQWFNLGFDDFGNPDPRTYLNLGFITPYAASQDSEDFVEILSMMLTYSKGEFDTIVSSGNSTGQAQIREKQKIVVDYFQDNFGIDLFELQKLTNQALLDSLD